MIVLLAYLAVFTIAFVLVHVLRGKRPAPTFGDEAAVTPDRAASVISILAIFLIWGAFTGSKLVPLHVPGPFLGQTSFAYTATDPSGATQKATVTLLVHRPEEHPELPVVSAGRGLAQDDAALAPAWRSTLLKPAENDVLGAKVTAVNGQPICPSSNDLEQPR